MVATRSRAQKGVQDDDMISEPDPDLILKKPARKVPSTATKTTGKVVTAQPKARNTRGKKIEVASELEIEAGNEETKENEIAKPTSKSAGRHNKVTRPPKSDEKVVEEAKQPTRSTRATKATTKDKKKIAERPKISLPIEAKPTKQTRGTAAVNKAPPLSPKKVTQVSKRQPRVAKTTNAKPAPGAVPRMVPNRGPGIGRKRTVSDENSDISDIHRVVDQDDEEEQDNDFRIHPFSLVTSTPRMVVSQPHEPAQSEASTSSGPTTPNDSPNPSFDGTEQDEDDLEDVESVSEADNSNDNMSCGSEDELCGPKTPMRRGNPSVQARYNLFTQETIRKQREKTQTPMSRSHKLPSQQETPQAQKYPDDSVQWASEAESTIFATTPDRVSVLEDHNGAPDIPGEEAAEIANEDISFIPDENILDGFGSVDESVTPRTISPVQLPSPPASTQSVSEVLTTLFSEEDEDEVASGLSEAEESCEDPDETIVVDESEFDEDRDMEAQSVQSTEIEDALLTNASDDNQAHDLQMQGSGEEVVLDSNPFPPIAPHPRLWKNSRYRNTFPIDFDEHLCTVKSLTEPEIDGNPSYPTGEATVEEDDFTLNSSRRDTVNFSEFLDVDALAEPMEEYQAQEKVTADSTIESLSLSKRQVGEMSPKKSPQVEVEVGKERVLEESPACFQAPDEKNEAVENQDEDRPGNSASGGTNLPHYALPTFAFDSRRRSLPAFNIRTPVKADRRPTTSDGASIPRVANPFVRHPRSRRGSTAATSCSTSPYRSRHILARSISRAAHDESPAPQTGALTPVATPVTIRDERRHLLAPRSTYEEHAQTVSGTTRFHNPIQVDTKRRKTVHRLAISQTPEKAHATPLNNSTHASPIATRVQTPNERRPRLAPRETYEEHARIVAAPERFNTPIKAQAKRRETVLAALPLDRTPMNRRTPIESSTPQNAKTTPITTPEERYPRRKAGEDNEEHAMTVAAPARFQTLLGSPPKRPATVQKPASLRKAALRAGIPSDWRTPIKTPLKSAAETPAQVPLTPHPAAPLRGVVALVEVFTLEGSSASAPFVALLQRLGAKTTRTFGERVTHVVFKDGSPTTLQRVRLNNKEVEEKTKTGMIIHCVNSRWVTDCDTQGARVDESDEAYVVDVTDVPRGGKRRRKSMEPAALLNFNGNLVRDRQGSLGRSSRRSSTLKFDSPAKKPALVDTVTATPNVEIATSMRDAGSPAVINDENRDDMTDSPITPAWIAAPDSLVQQTAPMNRVRKLQLKGDKKSQNRRLTFWTGAN